VSFVRQIDCEFLIIIHGFVEVSMVSLIFFSLDMQFFQRVLFYCYQVAGGNMCLYFGTNFVGCLKDSKGSFVLTSCKNHQMISVVCMS
jgi:hypothetical protein